MMNGRERAEGQPTGEATLQNELQSFAGMLDRRKWVIVASVIATMALALVFTIRQPKVYSSSAIVSVAVPASGAASQTDQATAAASAAGSQIVVISSSGYREAAAAEIERQRTADANSALKFKVTPFQIASRVTATTVGDTALIKVTATGPTPGAAQELAQRYAQYVVSQAAGQASTTADAQRKALQDQATAIRKQISSLQNDLSAATGSNADNIQEQIDANRQALTAVTLQLAQIGAQPSSDTPTLTVVSASTENGTPVSPRLKFNLAIAGVVGLLLGLVLAWIRDQLDRTVRSVDEIESLTARQVLATIPLVRQPDALSTPALADAYSFLRVNLGVTLGSGRGSVVVLTSSREGEGKTSTTIGLGRSLVGAGRRVLLMDVDLRRGGLSRTLGVDGRRGLTECLRGELAPEDALVMVGGMYVFPAGSGDLNSAALLDSARFENLLQDLRETYDYVLVDTTPARAIADAVLVGARSDGILLVARAGLVDRRELATAAHTLQGAAFNLLGVVVYTPEASDVGYEYQMVDPAPPGRKRRLAR
jgi:capsular exopolysaccharide synthesis family protein